MAAVGCCVREGGIVGRSIMTPSLSDSLSVVELRWTLVLLCLSRLSALGGLHTFYEKFAFGVVAFGCYKPVGLDCRFGIVKVTRSGCRFWVVKSQ